MKRDLLDILACPVCRSYPLGLEVEEADGDEVVRGSLICPGCKAIYPIEGSIPNMIPKK
ncbi:MAG: methytransferase partner Trm112 [Methanomassiliicoccales archaeon]|nr:MAG: methytransferase partner Trm112 [Methanomassiliicoccales archaeon]